MAVSLKRVFLTWLVVINVDVASAASLNAHGKLLYLSLSNTTEENGTETESSTSFRLLGAGACYFFDSSWCVGLDVLQFQRTDGSEGSSANSLASVEVDTDWWGTGISLAYIGKPWFFNGIYYFSGERESGSTTLISGLAWALEGGYYFDVRGLGVGPMLSYLKFNYEKIKDSTGTERLDGDPADSFFLPSLAMWVNF